MMQVRTFCNCIIIKNARKEDFRSMREHKRVERVLTWSWERSGKGVREHHRFVSRGSTRRWKWPRHSDEETPLLSCTSCWRWSSGYSFGWKPCWKLTEPLPHCSRSSLWTVSPRGQGIMEAGDALHKTGELWEVESPAQTWCFIVAN